jgi:hypothetical protein
MIKGEFLSKSTSIFIMYKCFRGTGFMVVCNNNWSDVALALAKQQNNPLNPEQ